MSDLALTSLFKASLETIYMVSVAGLVSIFFGLIVGCLVFITGKKQALENKWLHRVLSSLINVTRSVPFIILMISIIPFTRLLVGTTIGTNAAIVPLAIAAIPFFARITENALSEVSYGLIEAGQAMGASNWQIVTKVLLPESLPSLIRGATLTLIGLIGYSAMAGAVGGGGLGELAINYGYQRFDVVVLVETVLILIVMVQLLQWLGDLLAKKRRVHSLYYLCISLAVACVIYQSWLITGKEENTLRVGIMSGLPEKVLSVAQQVAEKDYGLHLQVVTFSDYVQPNTALANRSIDANIFQHAPYLDAQIKDRHYQLSVVGKTFVYPMGFYSQRIHDISQLKRNAIVAIQNDPSNGGRALLILQSAGLITLKKDVGVLATPQDIIANPKQLQFKLLDAAQLPRALKDADLVAINNDFVAAAGLSINQSVLKEGSDSPYANLIVARTEEKNSPDLQKLVSVMHSKAVLNETEKVFPNGAAIPAWSKYSRHYEEDMVRRGNP